MKNHKVHINICMCTIPHTRVHTSTYTMAHTHVNTNTHVNTRVVCIIRIIERNT